MPCKRKSIGMAISPSVSSVLQSICGHLPSESLKRLTSEELRWKGYNKQEMEYPRVRIAVVGDVHGDWCPVRDARALQALMPDLVLFTGDFGNENVELVKQVSRLEFPKAVILGNHDCWFTYTFSTSPVDPVQLQLQSLGECHIGYNRLDFTNLKLSVVGGRPFSSGGKRITSRLLLSERYGIENLKESAERISKFALEAPSDHILIFLAHNGPSGLGSNYTDICGKDWDLHSSTDYGDSDLAEALKLIKEKFPQRPVLVVFGHMHKELQFSRGSRNMLVAGSDRTVYLNAAVVPRIRDINETCNYDINERVTKHNFTVVDLMNGGVQKVSEVWVTVGKSEAFPAEAAVLFEMDKGSTSRFCSI